MNNRILTASLIAAAMLVSTNAVTPRNAKAAAKLSMVYPFPDFLDYTKLCKKLANSINARSKGLIELNVLPFNSVGMFQQGPAVKSGRVDMACYPAAFYARSIPENEAVSTSNSSPLSVRGNGGHDMLDKIHQQYFNVKYLGWTISGNRFRIYMKNKPAWTKDGLLDLKGVKLRNNPIYGAFFRALKGSTHNMKATQVYAALEKGAVNASAWTNLGLQGLKWDKFLRHAVKPDFYQTDIGWIVNLDRWNKLDSTVKKLLQTAVTEHSDSSRSYLEGLAQNEEAKLTKGGMQFHTVPSPNAYLKIAVDSAYDRMTARLKKTKRGAAHVAKLRSLYQK